jgi:4-hydroxybenzoate polyprenyltransferase
MAPQRRQKSPLRAARLNGDAVDNSARLQILLEDYSQGRDDERNWNVVLATLVAVAFTLIGLLAAAITQTCRFKSSSSCVSVPDYLVGAAPLLPVALMAYTQLLGTVATIRSFYLRAIETDIRQYAGPPLKALSPILPASYVEMMTEATSLRRGRLQYRITTFLIVTIIIVVFGGFAAYIGLHMDPITQVVMTVVYAPIVLLMASENYAAGPGGRSMFYSIARRYIVHRYTTGYTLQDLESESSHVKQNERSLPSYLLMPRPADWVKWIITPGAFVVTAWATGAFRNWHQFILVWLILEYLIYEARYQWNDIRGIHEDTNHPESTARLRLPSGSGTRRNIVASCLVGVLRLTLAVCIAAVAHLLPEVALLIGLVFGVAIAYEALRAASTSSRLSSLPALRSAAICAIWITVGLGYAIRSGTGFWLGGLRLLSLTAISGMLYFFTFGIMFVLLTWVLEAASYCSTDSIESIFRGPGLLAKPHIAILLRWTGWKVRDGAGNMPGAAEPVLKKKPGKHYAPWNIALLLTAGLGAVVGTGLVRSTPPLTAWGLVIAISLLGALLLIVLNRFTVRLAVTAAIAVALVGITFPAVHGALAIVAAIPWVVVAFDYAFFRDSSYQDLMDFGPNLFSAVKTAISTLVLLTLRLVLGRQTFDWLRTSSDEISVAIYVDSDNEEEVSWLLHRVDQLVRAMGYGDPIDVDLEHGSLFRRSKAIALQALSSEELRDRLAKAERGLELAGLELRQAQVDHGEATAVSMLLAEIKEIPRACIRAGSVMLVKYTSSDGPVLLVRTLSQLEIRALDRYPEIQKNPEALLESLATAVDALKPTHPEVEGPSAGPPPAQAG